MTKVNRNRTYGTAPEWRIIAKSLIEPGMGTEGRFSTATFASLSS
jgi:hypothetical protein